MVDSEWTGHAAPRGHGAVLVDGGGGGGGGVVAGPS